MKKKLAMALAGAAMTALVTVPASASPCTGGVIDNPLPPGQQPYGYRPNPTICPSGGDECVDNIIRRMERNYGAVGCDHNSAFASVYLNTTVYIRDAIRNDEFSDRPLWNRITETLGVYFVDTYKAWTKGQDSRVPEAWRIAFEAAHSENTSTVGDVFLAINAHINRDLAFVYYQTGADNIEDHAYLNTVLYESLPSSWMNVATYLDGTIFAQLGVIPPEMFDQVFVWRDQAWQNAQRLKAAPDAAARAVIAAEIEANATAIVHFIEASFPAADGANAARDAYCATNN